MKLLIKLLVVAIIGGALLAVAGYFLVPPAADKAVNEGSRFAFGVPASLGGIKASPGLTNTKLGFTDYELESPAGFTEPLLKIGNFDLGVGTGSILGGTKEVGAFTLENVNLTLVQDGTKSNLLPVLKHLQGLASGSGDGDTAPPAPDGGEREGSAGPRLKVGKVQIKGISARLVAKGIPGLEVDETFTVPAYERDFSALTGEDGLTVAEMAGALVESLKDEAMKAADGKIPAGALSAIEKTLEGGLAGGVDGAMDAAKGLVKDKADELGEKAQDALEDGKAKLEDEASKLQDAAKKKLQDGLGGAADDAKKELEKGLGNLLGGKKGGR